MQILVTISVDFFAFARKSTYLGNNLSLLVTVAVRKGGDRLWNGKNSDAFLAEGIGDLLE